MKTKLKLTPPIEIAPNLEPGIKVGDSWVTITYSSMPGEAGRIRYAWKILTPAGDFCGSDLLSGSSGGTLQCGLEFLLSLLSARAESWSEHKEDRGENADLFCEDVVKWCYKNSTEIELAIVDLEKNPAAIEQADWI